MIDLNHEAPERFPPSYSFRSEVKPQTIGFQNQTERKEDSSQRSDAYSKTDSRKDINSKSQFSRSNHIKNSPSLFEFISKIKTISVQTAPAEDQSLDGFTQRAEDGIQTVSDISAKSHEEHLLKRFAGPKDRPEKIKSALMRTKAKPQTTSKESPLALTAQTPPNLSSMLFDPKQMSFKRQKMTVNFLKEKLGDDFEVLKTLYLKCEGNLSEIEMRLDKEKANLVRLFPIAFGFATPTTQGSLNFNTKY